MSRFYKKAHFVIFEQSQSFIMIRRYSVLNLLTITVITVLVKSKNEKKFHYLEHFNAFARNSVFIRWKTANLLLIFKLKCDVMWKCDTPNIVFCSGTHSQLSRPLVLHSLALTVRSPVNNNDIQFQPVTSSQKYLLSKYLFC